MSPELCRPVALLLQAVHERLLATAVLAAVIHMAVRVLDWATCRRERGGEPPGNTAFAMMQIEIASPGFTVVRYPAERTWAET